MKKINLVTLLLLFTGVLHAQNMVKNPSFEEGLPAQPIKKSQTSGYEGRVFLPGWIVPTKASPDFFNHKTSSNNGRPVPIARTGNGLVGMVLAESRHSDQVMSTRYREYLQTILTEPLQQGQLYRISFWITIDRTSLWYAKNIGAVLTTDTIMRRDASSFNLTPAIVLNQSDSILKPADGWVEVCGEYRANGGEKVLTIGSFSNEYMLPIGADPMKVRGKHARNAYYFIDDVEVKKISSAEEVCPYNKNQVATYTKGNTYTGYIFLGAVIVLALIATRVL